MTMNAAPQNLTATRRHSRKGIISCALPAANILILLLLAAASAVAGLIAPGGTAAQYLDGAEKIYYFTIAPLVCLAGLILGLAGFFRSNDRKIFPVIGIIVNGLWIGLTVLFWAVLLLAMYAISQTPWR